MTTGRKDLAESIVRALEGVTPGDRAAFVVEPPPLSVGNPHRSPITIDANGNAILDHQSVKRRLLLDKAREAGDV